jgi:hypothetical protein
MLYVCPSNDPVSMYNSTTATHSQIEKIIIKMAPLVDTKTLENVAGLMRQLRQQYACVPALTTPLQYKQYIWVTNGIGMGYF